MRDSRGIQKPRASQHKQGKLRRCDPGHPEWLVGVAGVLAWPGRYCQAMNKHMPIRYAEDGAKYWMESDVAEGPDE